MRLIETVERPTEDYWGNERYENVRRPTRLGKGILSTVAGIAGIVATYGIFGDGNIDLGGDLHRRRSQDEMEEIAAAMKAERYTEASTADRYSMLFLQDPYPDTVEVGELEDGNGFIGKIQAVTATGENYEIGQDCLAGTAFDITASEIRGRASGDINAVASLSIEERDVVIYPAVSLGTPIRFNQEDSDILQPADDHTASTLDAYGCEPPML